MPNRILRDWTDSDNIDSLDVHSERFFTRLIMKVDDFGRYQANVKLLKAHLFPLKSDIRETDITRWLTACKESGLIALYAVAQKEYLQINNFKQVLRQKLEKYPAPNACNESAIHTTSDCIADVLPEEKRNETNPETEVESGKPPKQTDFDKREKDFYQTLAKQISSYTPEVLRNFYDYWREPNKNKTKMRFEQEKTWDLDLRLKRWVSNDFSKYKKQVQSSTGPSLSEIKASKILNEVA